MCTVCLHSSRSIRMIRLKIEVSTSTKACYSVCSVYFEGQSLLFFCHAPEKWGYGSPPSKKWGYAYPPYSPKVTPMPRCPVIIMVSSGSSSIALHHLSQSPMCCQRHQTAVPCVTFSQRLNLQLGFSPANLNKLRRRVELFHCVDCTPCTGLKYHASCRACQI